MGLNKVTYQDLVTVIAALNLNDIQDAIIALEGILPSIAPEYSVNTSYTPGDYVVYQNVLYKCTSSTSGAWNPSKWTAVNFADELKAYETSTDAEIRSLFADLVESITTEFSATAMYDVGDMVEKDGLIYKCIVPIITPEAWTASHWKAVDLSNEITEAQRDATEGYSDTLTAGDLTSDEYQTDTEPYLFRRTYNGASNHEMDTLTGGTVAWNQLCNSASVTVQSGHKYCMIKDGTASIGASTGTALTGLTSGTDMVFDLTQMFGTTIADAIYAMEQATAGSGVAWVNKYIDLSVYHAYDSGTLKSVEAVAHRMVGKNLLDKTMFADAISSVKYKPIYVGEGTYTMSTTAPKNSNDNANLFFLSGSVDTGAVTRVNGVWSGTTRTVTSENGYVTVGYCSRDGVDPNFYDTQIEFGSATAYEPYKCHTYKLDPSLTLRGIPKLTDGKLQYDGDTYEPSGQVVRRYGVVDLGTLTWTTGTDTIGQYFQANRPSDMARQYLIAIPANAVCSKYMVSPSNNVQDKNLAIGANVYVRDTTYSTAADFKTAMNGVMLVYLLATPTTETASPYEPTQVVYADGTEEYISQNIVPVGHVTKYPISLKTKLNDLPDAFKLYDLFVHDSVTTPSAVLSVTDGANDVPVKSMTIGIEPVQDLHGYDNPWPAGGGKNLFDVTRTSGVLNDVTVTVNSDKSITLNGTASTYAYMTLGTITLQAGTTYAISPRPTSLSSSCYYRLREVDFAIWGSERQYTPEQDATLTFEFVFPTGYVFSNVVLYPMIRLASVTDATYEPYSNICPISGWTQAKIFRTGFNVWDGETESGYIYNGTVYPSSSYWRSKNYVPVIPNQVYCVFVGSHDMQISTYGDAQTYVGTITGTWATQTTYLINIPNNVRYIKFYQPVAVDKDTCCINISDTSRNGQYEPYQGTTYTVTLPDTVYGGELTVNRDGTGTLVVDKGITTISALNFNYNASALRFGSNSPISDAEASGQYASSQLVCSFLPTNKYPVEDTIASHYGACIYTNKHVYIRVESDITTRDALNSAHGNETIVYKLATLQTYTLTAPQVRTLLGINNIWADTGDIESAVYPCDTKLYIDKKLQV